jgi:hypothetical protein
MLFSDAAKTFDMSRKSAAALLHRRRTRPRGSIDEQQRSASSICQIFSPHPHNIVSRGTADERNDDAARA